MSFSNIILNYFQNYRKSNKSLKNKSYLISERCGERCSDIKYKAVIAGVVSEYVALRCGVLVGHFETIHVSLGEVDDRR